MKFGKSDYGVDDLNFILKQREYIFLLQFLLGKENLDSDKKKKIG